MNKKDVDGSPAFSSPAFQKPLWFFCGHIIAPSGVLQRFFRVVRTFKGQNCVVFAVN
jgi:hypothetical protein